MTAARLLRRSLLPLVAAALATGCEVQATVQLIVAEDGSGTVEVAVGLDEEALAEVPDLDDDGVRDQADLAAMVRTDDLEAAGWRVAEPEAEGGVTWVRVVKPFGTPAEAEAVLAEVTGPDGPLRDLRVERDAGFGSTRFSFAGTADLSGGLEAFGDAGLAQALEGEPLGEDAARIEERLGQPLADAFRLDVVVDLPGRIDANSDHRSGGAARWSPRLGSESRALEATSTLRDVPVLAFTALAAISGVALVVALGLPVLRRRRPVVHPSEG